MSDNPKLVVDNYPGDSEPGAAASPTQASDGNGGGNIRKIEAKIAGLESAIAGLHGEVGGLKHSQNITIGAVVGVGAILLSVMIFVAVAVNGLPAQLIGIADSITGAITAAQSVDERAPIIINVPSSFVPNSSATPAPTPAVPPELKQPAPNDGS